MYCRELGSLAIRRVWLFFYHLGQGLEHLEGEAYYTVVSAPELEVESLIVVVEESFGEEPLVVVKTLGPLWDGFVLYLACLLTHQAYAPPLICLMYALRALLQTRFTSLGVRLLDRVLV
jgi:hypothetical protein